MRSVGMQGAGGEQARTGNVGPARELRLRDARHWSTADWAHWIGRLVLLLTGLVCFALGLVLGLQSNLGANSWTVLHDGISRHTPLTIGQASQLVGLGMLGVSWLVGIRPGIGTVLNMLVVGFAMDQILGHGLVDKAGPFPDPAGIVMLVAAIAVIGFATGMYIKAGFGAGPRDSFMLALTEITGLPIGPSRWALETLVVVIGAFLGGAFGIGTIVFAFLIGPSVSVGFRLFGLPTKSKSGARRVRR